jgi:hypothetical protein
MADSTNTTLLDPPYDRHAVWHQHAFPPDGAAFTHPDYDDHDWRSARFDAVEDRLGRIFVWSVAEERAVCVCDSRDTATIAAIALVQEHVRG